MGNIYFQMGNGIFVLFRSKHEVKLLIKLKNIFCRLFDMERKLSVFYYIVELFWQIVETIWRLFKCLRGMSKNKWRLLKNIYIDILLKFNCQLKRYDRLVKNKQKKMQVQTQFEYLRISANHYAFIRCFHTEPSIAKTKAQQGKFYIFLKYLCFRINLSVSIHPKLY